MSTLDTISHIKKIDKQGIYESIVQLPNQCLHAYQDASSTLKVPASYKNIKNIVMTGMGGSGLGARVIESVYANKLKYPLVRINDYNLPAWANQDTLVICSSYSGTTEETVSTAQQAIKNRCKWMAIAAGGTLVDLAKENKVPYYLVNPTHNPSKQPRMAIGYSILGQILLLEKAGLIDFKKTDLEKLIKAMNLVIKDNNVSVLHSKNKAKLLATSIFKKISITISSQHLNGAVHTFKNQQNENSKNLSVRFDIPEINHHLLEGLTFPKKEKKDLLFIFLQSSLYPERIIQRMDITKEIVDRQNIESYVWKAKSTTPLSQVFEFIQFGAFVNFYLCILNGVNPAPIPWVDYLKKRLGQPLGQWK